jgi:hypothetical protein
MSEFVHERASPVSGHLMTSRLSTSLCRVIFKSPEVNDATLFVSILQLDLTVLKELGHPGDFATTFCLPQVANLFVIHQSVDRILQQKAEREEVEKAIAEREALLNSSSPEMTVQETRTEIPTMQPKITSLDTAIPAPSHQATHGNTGPEQRPKRSYGPGRHRASSRSDSPSSRPTPPPKSEDIPGPPRYGITPLINIGTSLYTALLGFHLILHFI